MSKRKPKRSVWKAWALIDGTTLLAVSLTSVFTKQERTLDSRIVRCEVIVKAR